jgi:hypothetical protein
MKALKIITWIILVLLAVIQFIRPKENKDAGMLPTDISSMYSVPSKVQAILKAACYDCHSNNTQYPWYARIEPVGWVLSRHIKEGKTNLNFSEFGTYSQRKQKNKLKAVINSINENTMPILSYAKIHPEARLSREEKALLIEWASNTRDSLNNQTQSW